MIRNVFWETKEIDDQERRHVAHCFDYLRQGIQCASDMTLEWANWEGEEGPRIDGWGVVHRRCKSWVSLLSCFCSCLVMWGMERG
jgi:hypothetical protein